MEGRRLIVPKRAKLPRGRVDYQDFGIQSSHQSGVENVVLPQILVEGRRNSNKFDFAAAVTSSKAQSSEGEYTRKTTVYIPRQLSLKRLIDVYEG